MKHSSRVAASPRTRLRLRRPTMVGAALLVGLCMAPACSDDAATTSSSSTTTASSDATSTPTSAAETGSPGSADPGVSDADPDGSGDDTDPTGDAGPPPTEKDPAATTTSLLPAASGVPDQPATNSLGEPITLDETALLACAQNQIAWVALQRGAASEASDALVIAAARADASAVADIKASASTLASASSSDSPGPDVDRFLALCVEHGFEY